jgi:hypothetical protein
VSKSTKGKKGMVGTSSSSRHRIQPLSHDLFSLEVLLVSISQVFSAFFALPSANLVDFSALTLAAVAASKAFREALSSASSDEMRALAVAKASAVQQGGKEKSSKKQRKAYKISKYRKTNSPSEALAAFRYSTHSLPKATNFFIKFCSEIAHEYQQAKTEVNMPVFSRTSSEELVD